MSNRKRYFQWIAGEMQGDIVILESIEEFEGETFYNFDDGESCNLRFISKKTNSVLDLKQKFMVEIDSPSNAWTFEEIQPKKYIDKSMNGEDIDIPSLHDILQAHGENTSIENSDIGTLKLIPPKQEQDYMELPSASDYVKVIEQPKPIPKVQQTEQPSESTTQASEQVKSDSQETVVQKPVVESPKQTAIFDPVQILVGSCKKHDTPVDLTITLKLPSSYIANIASSEFEDGFEKFIDCVVKDIKTDMIIDELKNALRKAYSSESDQAEK